MNLYSDLWSGGIMVSLNSQFTVSLNPMEKLQRIKQLLSDHVGQYVLLREKSGRNTLTYFVYLETAQQGVYWCFDSQGRKRCMLTKWISHVDILTNLLNIVFLDR